jgi:hypothetical protein
LDLRVDRHDFRNLLLEPPPQKVHFGPGIFRMQERRKSEREDEGEWLHFHGDVDAIP